MTRIVPVNAETVPADSRPLLDQVKAKLGMTPNLFSTFAHSGAALKGYLKLSESLGQGVLDNKTREQIALAVAEANSCDYCLSAHTAVGKMVGLNAEQIQNARRAQAESPKTEALLKLASEIVESRGFVSDETLAGARDNGASEAELIEVVTNTALNLLTNYLNHVAQTEIDFPRAEPLPVESSCGTECQV